MLGACPLPEPAVTDINRQRVAPFAGGHRPGEHQGVRVWKSTKTECESCRQVDRRRMVLAPCSVLTKNDAEWFKIKLSNIYKFMYAISHIYEEKISINEVV